MHKHRHAHTAIQIDASFVRCQSIKLSAKGRRKMERFGWKCFRPNYTDKKAKSKFVLRVFKFENWINQCCTLYHVLTVPIQNSFDFILHPLWFRVYHHSCKHWLNDFMAVEFMWLKKCVQLNCNNNVTISFNVYMNLHFVLFSISNHLWHSHLKCNSNTVFMLIC